MENSSSANLDATETKPVEGPMPPKRESIFDKIDLKKVVLIASSLLIMILIVGGMYLFVNRRQTPSISGGSPQAAKEYVNPNGFKFNYTEDVEIIEAESGITLSGDTEMTFVVNPADEPLLKIVDDIANNFGLSPENPEYSLQTVNSRTGYVLQYEGKDYYYFPLYGDYYLEVVSDEGNEKAFEVMSTLSFIPPQPRIN